MFDLFLFLTTLFSIFIVLDIYRNYKIDYPKTASFRRLNPEWFEFNIFWYDEKDQQTFYAKSIGLNKQKNLIMEFEDDTYATLSSTNVRTCVFHVPTNQVPQATEFF